MRKSVISALLVVGLSVGIHYAAAADVDLHSLSFIELKSLQDQVYAEMLTRPEWTEVSVPAGVYEVGVDIPEGMWTITAEEHAWVSIFVGQEVDDTRSYITSEHYVWETITGKLSEYANETTTDTVSINLPNGYYISIDGPVVFTRYTKPALGF